MYESGYFLNSHTGENEHRPYERCMALGASSLSDAQLIAAILRTGTKGIDATKLAEEIIKIMWQEIFRISNTKKFWMRYYFPYN